uniref:AAA+ ATPase domain-containing protein n=1 Tax=Hemiselmis tepida TaxID=464990 RepID=A0A7S0VPX4_9CRYP
MAHAGMTVGDLGDPKTRADMEKDPSQMEAHALALRQRVAVLQGPPGTGKTFIGRVIVDTVLTAPLKRGGETPRVLVLTYTNHALDSFLEELIEEGLDLKNIVRIGASKKMNERLKSRCIHELKQGNQFDRYQKQRYAMLKKEMEEAESRIKHLRGSLSRSMWGATDKTWEIVSSFLCGEGPGSEEYKAYEQFLVSDEALGGGKEGMKVVGKKGKALSRSAKWAAWYQGKDEPKSLQSAPAARGRTAGIWALNSHERMDLVAKWRNETLQPLVEELANWIKKHERASSQLDELRNESIVPIIKEAKVIACTTTAAAKYAGILRDSDIAVVVIEEAAEILEAHVLTALSSNVKHLVQIGDHKQLRPKLENYKLRVESGGGVDFDKSIFERLATEKGIDGTMFPAACLDVQHRMRPEISTLVRSFMYPELKDGEGTLNRTHVRGLTSDVVFITHEEPEQGEEDLSGMGPTRSKINPHEVEMAVQTVEYLMKQGYQANQMVVLTPYLGQLVELRRGLSETSLSAEIGDRDQSDLRNYLSGDMEQANTPSHSIGAAASAKEERVVRVATIDNYQGEQADIVIATLVRSNDEGQIGFLRENQRVNVLLSRARIGFILIGNSRTLLNCKNPRGRKLWETILGKMNVFDGLPVVCENHKTEQLLKKKSDFMEYAKDGGCAVVCGMPLPSCRQPEGHKHMCPLRCHPLGQFPHANVECRVLVDAKCPHGHKVKRQCSSDTPQPCSAKVQDNCPNGHFRDRKCREAPLQQCDKCDREEDRRVLRQKLAMEAAEAEEKKACDAQDRLDVLLDSIAVEKAQAAAEATTRRKEHEARLCAEQLSQQRKLRREAAVQEDVRKRENLAAKLLDAGSSDCSRLAATSADQTSSSETWESSASVGEGLPQRGKFAVRKQAGAVTSEEEPPRQKRAKVSKGETQMDPETAPAKGTEQNGAVAAARNIPNQPPVILSGGFEDAKIAIEELNKKKPNYKKAYELSKKVVEKITDCNGHACGEAAFLLAGIGLGDRTETMRKDYDDLLRRFPLHSVDLMTKAVLLFAGAEIEDKFGQFPMTAREKARLFLEVPATDQVMSAWAARCEEIVAIQDQPDPKRHKGQSQAKPVTQSDMWEKFKANVKDKGKELLPAAMDDLMGMIGLERVKREFRSELERIKIAKEQGISTDSSSYNARFDGNPGVGKTTVARLYSQLLVELGILPEKAKVFETSGPKLASGGLKELEDLLKKGQQVGGAVIFVDEAYALNPKEDSNGRQVLDFLLPHAEKLKGEYGRIVFIVAGYSKHMEKLFEHNEGLASRFPRRFVFEDYTDEELEKILAGHLANPNGVKPSKATGYSAKASKSKPLSVVRPSSSTAAVDRTRLQNARIFQQQASGMRSLPQDGAVKQDEWGHMWTYDVDSYTWKGDYGNECGFGPNNDGPHRLGDDVNPIYSSGTDSDGNGVRAYVFDRDRSVWHVSGDKGSTAPGYPGEPPPQSSFTFSLSDPKWGRIAARRLGRMRGKMGFGNARAVKNLFDDARRRQAERITMERAAGQNPNISELRRDDLLGPRAEAAKLESCQALRELQAMEGLDAVKRSVRNLLDLVIKNADREEQETQLLEVTLNRVFLGNPGTGKTTVAKLYGRILCDFGLLSKGDVIVKNPSDFKGDVLGSSERNTREILKAAEGCVLVIDEAYSLNPSTGSAGGSSKDPYLSAVIDTIVECVQAVPGDDRVVVLCGYRKEMEAMVKDSNPGLARRFQLDCAFEFEDYDDSALVRILRGKAERAGLAIGLDTAVYAVERLEKARSQGNFGNAGAVENLLSQAKLAMVAAGRSELRRCDFCPEAGEDEGREEDIFADLQGCDELIARLKVIRASIKMAVGMGQDRANGVEFNYLFTGAPGTGKTTVARRMGRMFNSFGLLPTDEVVEASASDFVTGYVGQAGKVTRDTMAKAKGKVLFIDEAYQLDPRHGGSYMSEVVDEMVKCLTSEDLKGKMVVILAGYEADVDAMLNVNQGLRSRFSEKLHFRDISPETACDMFETKLKQNHGLALDLPPEGAAAVLSLTRRLVDAPNFANGRDVETWSKRTFQEVATRTGGQGGRVEVRDLEKALESLLETKKEVPPKGSALASATRDPAAEAQAQHAPALPARVTRATAAAARAQGEAEGTEGEGEGAVVAQEALQGRQGQVCTAEHALPQSPGHVRFRGAHGDPTLASLQDVLDNMGLNTEEGARMLRDADPEGERMQQVARELAARLGVTVGEATERLRDWQRDMGAMLNTMDEEARKVKEGLHKLRAIWRCGVCGAADKPYIVCWVAPFIVRYEPGGVTGNS